jgi:hypothetical protein
MNKLSTKHKRVSNQSTDDHEDGGHVFENITKQDSPSSRERIKKMLNARQRDLDLCVIVSYIGGS